MTTANLELEVNLGAEAYEDLLDLAANVITHWADEVSIELVDEDGDEIIFRIKECDGPEFVLTKSDIEATIRDIIERRFRASSDLRNTLAAYCLGVDTDLDLDGYDCDRLVQLACFNEVVYG